MAFDRVNFLGLSVREARCNLGWNEQSSTFAVSLVRDPTNGDVVNTPPIGYPVRFQLGSFRWQGLLQRFDEKNDRSGKPVYEALCVSPTEVLRACELIIGQYDATTFAVPNLFNCYGYWESTGFGNSLANPTGMPWNRVVSALNALCNSPVDTLYGGPVNYRGVRYLIDLSQLPAAPSYYRLAGVSINLLDAISRVCADFACMFFVELDGFIIRVRTRSSYVQPPLGTVAQLVTLNQGNVIRNSLSNELALGVQTSAFLFGADQTTLLTAGVDDMRSFWGYDINGSPILGNLATWIFGPDPNANPLPTGQPFEAPPPSGRNPWIPFPPNLLNGFIGPGLGQNNWSSGVPDPRGLYVVTDDRLPRNGARGMINGFACAVVPTEYMDLPAQGVEDVLGTLVYNCDLIEMRLALAGIGPWQEFITRWKPEIAQKIYGFTPNPKKPTAPWLNNDFVDATKKNILAQGNDAIRSDLVPRRQRLYELVRGFATDFMGKKFLVEIPSVLRKQDPETLQFTTSAEPCPTAWISEGQRPLGLSELNEDRFTDELGRFPPFVSYEDIRTSDLTRISANDAVIEDFNLFVRGRIDPQLVFTPNPAVLLTLGSALYDKPVELAGDFTLIGAALQHRQEDFAKTAKNTAIGYRIFPAPRYPDAVAVPMKSNTSVYGPWYAIGAPGRVLADQDNNLAPWNYGGYDLMNQAALARVANAAANLQVSEAGELVLAGAPTATLGDIMIAGGPVITNMDVGYGLQGVQTSYRFSTHTPRLGLNRQLLDRVQRQALLGVELRKTLRQALREKMTSSVAQEMAWRGYQSNLAIEHAKRTLHDVLVTAALDETVSGVLNRRVQIHSVPCQEAGPMLQADDPETFGQTALMGFTGMLRPFTTAPWDEANTFSGLWTPASGFSNDAVPSVSTLNPFRAGNDMEVMLWSDEEGYGGFKYYDGGTEDAPSNFAGQALRGPLMVTGWGHTLDGGVVPSGTARNSFHSNYLRRSDLWRSGPVDHVWDENRGVWTSHDIFEGTVEDGDLAARGTGKVRLTVNGTATNKIVPVKNIFNSAVSSGTVVVLGYSVLRGGLIVTGADC